MNKAAGIAVAVTAAVLHKIASILVGKLKFQPMM